ncbi:MAG: methyl-accepting chemotaxis protein [Nannocystaceae bacterium]
MSSDAIRPGDRQMGMGTKIVALVAICTLAPALFAYGLSLTQEAHSVLDVAGERVVSSGRSIEEIFSQHERILQVFAGTPPTSGLIRSEAKAGIDPSDGSTTQLWQQRLATIGKGFLATYESVERLEYVHGESGSLVTIERGAEAGELVVTTPEPGTATGGEPSTGLRRRVSESAIAGQVRFAVAEVGAEPTVTRKTAPPKDRVLQFAQGRSDVRGVVDGVRAVAVLTLPLFYVLSQLDAEAPLHGGTEQVVDSAGRVLARREGAVDQPRWEIVAAGAASVPAGVMRAAFQGGTVDLDGQHHIVSAPVWPARRGDGRAWHYVYSISDAALYGAVWERTRLLGTLMACFLVVAFVAGVAMARATSKRIAGFVAGVSAENRRLAGLSRRLNAASANLGTASGQQSASIEDIAGRLGELDRVGKSARRATSEAAHSAEGMRDSCDAGRVAMRELQLSSEQLKSAALRVEGFRNVMESISEKTRAIDEIVFETKLLSFNASIEAARAGEAGSGFAVVAVEISRLAEMSGDSAASIAGLLDESRTEAEAVIGAIGEATVQSGQVAERTFTAFEAIDKEVKTVAEHMTLTTEAQTEEFEELGRIASVMGEIEAATEHATAAVRKLTGVSKDLRSGTRTLDAGICTLSREVLGRRVKAPSLEAPDPSIPGSTAHPRVGRPASKASRLARRITS